MAKNSENKTSNSYNLKSYSQNTTGKNSVTNSTGTDKTSNKSTNKTDNKMTNKTSDSTTDATDCHY